MISPIFISDEKSPLAIEAAQSNNKTVVALFLSDDDDASKHTVDNFLTIGVEMAVGRMLTMQGGNHSALAQGRRRVEILEIVQREPYLQVKVRPIHDNFRKTRTLLATMRTTRRLFEQCVELNDSLPEEAHLYSINIDDPNWLADMVASTLSISSVIRKELLLLVHPADRLKQLNHILAEELEVLELEDEINAQVQT
jgi:ATP-dependent Lon protease